MRPAGAPIARVVVEVEPYHLDHVHDYTVPPELGATVRPGQRVMVPFGGRLRRGLIDEVTEHSAVPQHRLRPLRRLLGDHVWATAEDRDVLRWAARRYMAPVADVVRHALPERVVAVERRASAAGWYPVAPVPVTRASGTDPAPGGSTGRSWPDWDRYDGGPALVDACRAGRGAFYWRPLPRDDVGARLAELAETTLAGGRSVLVVTPDPVSTAADAVVRVAADLGVDARGTGRTATYRAWLRCRTGDVRVCVGERGVAFWPLVDPGLFVVLDEPNPALKERRSPRHHAREVLLERARRSGAVALLVGLVPSARAWALLRRRRVRTVVGVRADERREAPRVRLVSQQGGVRTRLSAAAVEAIRGSVAADRYAVVVAGRRGEGYAPVCAACGERRRCPRCGTTTAGPVDAPVCEGCGWRGRRDAPCVDCGHARFVPLAAGAGRIAAELRRTVRAPVAVLEGHAAPAPPPPAVLVMTRGSVVDAPPGPVDAVVLADVDAALRRPALDATEDTLRLAMEVARWAAIRPPPAAQDEPGRRTPTRSRGTDVVVETRDPDHPVLQALVRWDPGGFWRREAAVRAPLRFPPAASAIRIEAEREHVERLASLRDELPPGDELLGPVPRDGRAVVLVKTDDHVATIAALDRPRRALSRDGVMLRVDVDPVDVG